MSEAQYPCNNISMCSIILIGKFRFPSCILSHVHTPDNYEYYCDDIVEYLEKEN
jgi:hypothetical protein